MKAELSINSMVEALHEYYYVGSLSERDAVKYRLIKKYWEKVSPQLQMEAKNLFDVGKEKFDELFRAEVCKPNPLLKMLKTKGDW